MKRLEIFSLFLTLLVLSVCSAQAQSVKRVSLTNGNRKIVVTDAARPGEKDNYVIRLRRGQIVSINIDWVNGEGIGIENEDAVSGYVIVQPNGEKFEDPQDGTFEVTRSGDYKVTVRPVYRRKSYRYKLIFTLE